MDNYLEFLTQKKQMEIKNSLNSDLKKDIKETATKFLAGNMININGENIDLFFADAIIKAYKFEKYWRKIDWEKLLEKEPKEEQ